MTRFTDEPSKIGSFAELPGSWPDPASLTALTDDAALALARSVSPQIADLLSGNPASAERVIGELFLENSFWRDHVALSWSLRTFQSIRAIAAAIPTYLEKVAVERSSVHLLEEAVRAVNLPNGLSFIRIPFTFRTTAPLATCTATFKLVLLKAEPKPKVLTVTTALKELDACPWKGIKGTGTVAPKATMPAFVDVLVVGAGHGGLCMSAYFKSLGLDFVTIDKSVETGDCWRNRYDSTTLHTTKMFSELPYMRYPAELPKYLKKDHLAAFYRDYVKDFELPVFHSRTCKTAVWSQEKLFWAIELDGLNGVETLTAKHLVFATGTLGHAPYMPEIRGKELYKGAVLHSSTYMNATLWKGKRVAVVGAATTACDIALDAARAGAEVTIIQRGETRIYPQEHIGRLLDMLFTESMPTELCDELATEDPLKLVDSLSAGSLAEAATELNNGYYEDLRKAGLKVKTFGSPQEQLLCLGGRHYIDIGACQAIRNGQIKIKSDSRISHFTEDGLAFDDGSTLACDVVCFATGFLKDQRRHISSIIGEDIAAKLSPVWGVDSEGEVRGTWRPSGHDALWFQGGEMQTMRYYGKFLALQVAAGVAGCRLHT